MGFEVAVTRDFEVAIGFETAAVSVEAEGVDGGRLGSGRLGSGRLGNRAVRIKFLWQVVGRQLRSTFPPRCRLIRHRRL